MPNYVVYLHAFTENANGERHPPQSDSDPICYGVYVLDDSNVDDMPEDEDFDTLEQAQAFANEMAAKYDTEIETY